MRVQDRRFRTGRVYTVYGVKWTRHSNFAKQEMQWTTRASHPVRIVRDKFGRYVLMCGRHNLFATTRRLDRAFRLAAEHMGILALRMP